jgi:transposase
MTAPEQAPRKSKNDHYTISVRLEAVRLVEPGLSQQAVRQQYGVGYMTLLAWLKRYGGAVYVQMRQQFTAAHKQHITRELLDGRLSEDEALLKYVHFPK